MKYFRYKIVDAISYLMKFRKENAGAITYMKYFRYKIVDAISYLKKFRKENASAKPI